MRIPWQLLLLPHAGHQPRMCTGNNPADLLTRKKAGDAVNLEIDMLARYLARWQETA